MKILVTVTVEFTHEVEVPEVPKKFQQQVIFAEAARRYHTQLHNQLAGSEVTMLDFDVSALEVWPADEDTDSGDALWEGAP